MTKRQIVVIVAPPVLVAVMYPVFQLLSGALGETVGWYLGLLIYWIFWCAVFPLIIIGKENIKTIIQPRKLNLKILLLVSFPILIASLYTLIPGMEYQKPNTWIFFLLLLTTFGNGFFEEVLWRGVFMILFPDNIMLRIIWPSIWFALWHFVPGSVHSDSNVIALVIGAGIFGFYLSFLAKYTHTIWWSIVIHTLSGIIMII
jgi:membrane protease YdiL (CAAX protease family)